MCEGGGIANVTIIERSEMNLEPTDEQVMLRDLVRRFLADRTDAAAIGSGPMSRDDWHALGELGLFSFMLPERGGGMGGAPQDAMIVAEELGRALAITPFAESILGAADIIARYGTEDQVARWVEPALAGSAVLALAVGDVTVRDGALHGRCDFVRWAADAEALVVLDRDTAYLVPAGSGVTITPMRLADCSTAGCDVGRRCRRGHPAAGGRGRYLPCARPARLHSRTGRCDGAPL